MAPPMDKLSKRSARKERRAAKRAETEAIEAATGSKRAVVGRKRGKKAPSLSKLKKDLWKEISLFVRAKSEKCWGCGVNDTQVAAHIVPSHEGAATRFFLPNLYPACVPCNGDEKWHRGTWVKRHESIFGVDYVNALYDFSRTTFQLKKHWVLEQIERMKKLRGKLGH